MWNQICWLNCLPLSTLMHIFKNGNIKTKTRSSMFWSEINNWLTLLHNYTPVFPVETFAPEGTVPIGITAAIFRLTNFFILVEQQYIQILCQDSHMCRTCTNTTASGNQMFILMRMWWSTVLNLNMSTLLVWHSLDTHHNTHLSTPKECLCTHKYMHLQSLWLR